MRRSTGVVLVVLTLLLLPAVASYAGGGHAGGHGSGSSNCHPGHRGAHDAVGLGFPWWDPLFLDSYPDAELDVPDPSAVPEESPAYQPPPAFWLYCPSAKAYYPTITTCRDPWMKIPPPPQ